MDLVQLNPKVTEFLDAASHPLRRKIELLRKLIMRTEQVFSENIKWNGPNYNLIDRDYLTMCISPPKKIQ